MSNTVASMLKSRRKLLGLSVREVVEALKLNGVNISEKTLYGWEAGNRQPDADEFLVLCKIYAIGSLSEIEKAPSISDEAMKIAARYEKLDSVGRGAVNAIMKYEESRMTEELQKVSHLDAESGTMLDMIVYTNPSAAGIPLYAENDYERIEFPASQVPRGADFGVRISGDSMEPTIHNGTIVWVHKVPELQEGQIGIFMVDDGAVCKRFHKAGRGVELWSDNYKYDPIKVSEFERLGIVGRVLEYK